MTRANIAKDLELTRNKFGNPLTEGMRSLIVRYTESPNVELWNRIRMAVLAMDRDGEEMYLWRAITLIDRTFPGTTERDADGNRIWRRIPTAEMVERAVEFSTH